MKKYIVPILGFILIFSTFPVSAAETILEDISCDDVINLIQDKEPKKVYFYDKNGIETGWNIDYSNFTLTATELKGMPIYRLCEFKWKKEVYLTKPNHGDSERMIYIKDGISNYGAIRHIGYFLIKQYEEKFKKIEEEKRKEQTKVVTITSTIDSGISDWEKAKAEFDRTINNKTPLQSNPTITESVVNTNTKISPKNQAKAKIIRNKILTLKKQIEQLEKQLNGLN